MQLLAALGQIAAIWVAADLGFHFLLPALGVDTSYNASSVSIAIYYLFWAGFATIALWPIYQTWSHHAKWETFERRGVSLLIWTIAFAGSVLFAAYILPLLPAVNWTESWEPPEFVRANPFYFIPKSADILLQQLLIVALTLVLAAQKYSVLKMSAICAALFGGIHVMLVLGNVPLLYVIRFMISAGVFGFMFPYLILRIRYGLAYSYMVHWAYYAISVLLPHIFLSSVR